MTGEEFARRKESERQRAYYHAHREEILEKQRVKRALGQPKRNAQMKAWRAANAEKVARYQARYREEHREEINAKSRERMRAKRAAQKENET